MAVVWPHFFTITDSGKFFELLISAVISEQRTYVVGTSLRKTFCIHLKRNVSLNRLWVFCSTIFLKHTDVVSILRHMAQVVLRPIYK